MMGAAIVQERKADPADHLHLIRSVLNMPRYRYVTKSIGRKDAFQAGFLGLASACRKRHPSHPKFDAYAVRSIGNRLLLEYCIDRPIRLPESFYKTTRRKTPVERPDYDDVQRALRVVNMEFSDNLHYYDAAEPTPMEPDDDSVSRVDALLETLEPKHRDVIRHHYGLDGCAPGSPGEVGRRLGLARMTVVSRLKRAVEILQATHARRAG